VRLEDIGKMTQPAPAFDEAALVQRAQQGDREAFALLYDRYFERVYDFVRRTLRSDSDAADVTQEVFIKAMASIGTLANPAVFKSWLFTVARNLSISRIRGRRETLSLDYGADAESDTTLADLVPDSDIGGSPEDATEQAEVAALVWQVARGLDPRQYTVLDLTVRQELSAEEMAEVLGVTRNNAYVMVNRTKAAFVQSTSDYLLYEDGRKHCPLLIEDLSRAKVSVFSPTARKVIDRHLKQCPRCAERKKKLPLPLSVFGAFAAAMPPAGLHERIRTTILETPVGSAPPPPPAGTAGIGGGGRHIELRGSSLMAGGIAAGMIVALMGGCATYLALTGGGGDDLPAEFAPVTTASEPVVATPTPADARAPQTSTATTAATSTAAPSNTAMPPSPTVVSSTAVPQPATPTSTASPTSTPSPSATPSPTATQTRTPTITPTPTATPTSTPTPTVFVPPPTLVPTPVPLTFSGSIQHCFVSVNGGLRVTVTMGNVNGEPLSGTATFDGESANFAFNGNVGVATVQTPYVPESASLAIFTPTRQANTSFPVQGSLCN